MDTGVIASREFIVRVLERNERLELWASG